MNFSIDRGNLRILLTTHKFVNELLLFFEEEEKKKDFAYRHLRSVAWELTPLFGPWIIFWSGAWDLISKLTDPCWC